jgi:YegS/Rv2252/BmrU family lipid kinase
MAIKKILVVLNPAAGKENTSMVRESILRSCNPEGIEVEIYETSPSEDIGAAVRTRLTDHFNAVIAAGGDGTVAAVIDGLAGSGLPLGIIPIGTGNLIARELGIPLEVRKAAALLAGGYRLKKMDAMRMGNRLYALNVSVGVTAAAVKGTTREKKRRYGLIAYFISLLSHLFTPAKGRLAVTVDGMLQTSRALEVIIFNGGFLARLLYPTRTDIRLDDGRLDVWVLNANTLLDYPRNFYELLFRRPERHRVRFIPSVKHVSIASSTRLPVQADGDIIGTLPVELDLMPGAVNVIVPEPQVGVLDNLKDFISAYPLGKLWSGLLKRKPA